MKIDITVILNFNFAENEQKAEKVHAPTMVCGKITLAFWKSLQSRYIWLDFISSTAFLLCLLEERKTEQWDREERESVCFRQPLSFVIVPFQICLCLCLFSCSQLLLLQRLGFYASFNYLTIIISLLLYAKFPFLMQCCVCAYVPFLFISLTRQVCFYSPLLQQL